MLRGRGNSRFAPLRDVYCDFVRLCAGNFCRFVFFCYFCTMDNPLFSIITITFNAENELPITMKSVADQSCREFEHLLIDGASSDNTVSIARELGVRELRILSERDNGLYDAMNKGLGMAKGEYVLFLNAGDSFATSETLAKYASAIREFSSRGCVGYKDSSVGPDIVYGDTVIVDADGNELRPRHLSVPDLLTFKSFSHGMLVCHQAFCVKRGLAPLYDLKYRYSADYDWTVKCIKAASPERCVNLDTVAIRYLDAGMTEKHKMDSLKERFSIMAHHYGLNVAIARHLSFIPRAIARKFL